MAKVFIEHSKLGKLITFHISHLDAQGRSVVSLNEENEWEFLLSPKTARELIRALEEQLDIAQVKDENKSLAW